MTREEIKKELQYFTKKYQGAARSRLVYSIKKNNPDLYNNILIQTNYLQTDNFLERIHHIQNNLNFQPLCINCQQKFAKFDQKNQKYQLFCSNSCSNKFKVIDKVVFVHNNIDSIPNYSRLKLKDKINELLLNYNIDSKRTFMSLANSKKNNEFFLISLQIIKETLYLPVDCKFSERVFHILNDLYTIPICPFCNKNELNFQYFEKGYSRSCSTTCMQKNFKSEISDIEKISRDEIKEKINKIIKNDPKYKNIFSFLGLLSNSFQKQILELKNQIILNTQYLPKDSSISERLYHIYNNLFVIQKCHKCGQELNYKNIFQGYSGCCIEIDREHVSKKIKKTFKYKKQKIYNINQNLERMPRSEIKIQLNKLIKNYQKYINVLLTNNNYIDLSQQIIRTTDYLPKDSKFKERIYHILNDLKSVPKCLCGKKLNFNESSNQYHTSCKNCLKQNLDSLISKYYQKIKNTQIKREDLKIKINKIIKENDFDLNLKNNMRSFLSTIYSKKYVKLYASILLTTKYLPNKCLFSERIYHILNDLFERPKCPICKKEHLSFHSFKNGYRSFCKKCALSNETTSHKKRQSLIKSRKRIQNYKIKTIKSREEIKKEIKLICHHNNINTFKQLCSIINNTFSGKILELKHQIIETTNYLDISCKFTERLYQIAYDLFTVPICRYCNERLVYFINSAKGYSEACMRECKLYHYLISPERIGKNYKCHTTFKEYIEGKGIKNQKLKYEHTVCGHIFWDSIANGKRPICPKCFGKNLNSSRGEMEVVEFCKQYFDDIILHDRTILSGKELDIVIPQINLAIEFNGIYYHSQKDKKYHIEKTKTCNLWGIDLIHIFDDEWHFKKDIVKSILKAKFGKIKTKIPARKCKIEEIDSEFAEQWLLGNHLQGSIKGRHFGLIYNNDLVCLMTVGKTRFQKNNQNENIYEIYRFCNKLNTIVQGGFSKLLNFIIMNINIDRIISYVDLRFGKGEYYKQLGFTEINRTSPGFYYFKSYHRYNRQTFQKHKLPQLVGTLIESFDPNLTEEQNMFNNGYKKVYDCGNIVFELVVNPFSESEKNIIKNYINSLDIPLDH